MPTATTLTHEYTGRGSAVELFHSRDPEILVSGAAGTGKSRGCLEKVHLAMMKYPRAKALLLRKTMASLASTGLQTWQEFVVNEALLSGEVTYFGGSVREPPQYRYSNGSMVAIGGLDNPTKVMSSEYDIVYIQESTELTVKDWEFVSTRLRNGRMPYQQIIADANPDTPTHWLKQRCDRGTTLMLTSTHEENPRLYEECAPDAPGAREWSNAGTPMWLRVTERGAAYMARLDALTGVRYLRLRKGLWVAAEGLIYESFAPAVHVIKRFPIPMEWPRYWSVDFGLVNPFVLQCWAQDPDGRLIMYREIYRTQRTVDEHCFDIMAEVSRPDPEWTAPPKTSDGRPFQLMAHHGRIWTEPRPVKIITDHDAESRRTLERHLGQATKHADKRVFEGIQQVVRRMRRDPGSGHAGLFLMKDSVVFRDEALVGEGRPASTIEEIPGYVWLRRGVAGGSVNDKKLQDEPLKENDHGCLIAGTFVETNAGSLPIETVRPGALVATRDGWHAVLASGMTQAAAPVFAVELSSGRTLTGTGDHPVWVEGRGWVRLDELRYADMLLSWPASDSRASSSGVTPMRKGGPNGPISRPASPIGRRAGSAFTKKSGAPFTVTSPKVMRSIMSTSNRRTMILPTWSASRSTSTKSYIVNAGSSAGGSEASARHALRQLPSGTAAMKAGRGTASTRVRSGMASSIVKKPVSSVTRNSRLAISGATSASVPTTASRHTGGRRASTMSSVGAHSVAPSSQSTVTPVPAPAVVSVLSVSVAGTAPVFNLTVAGAPEYFAAGVLVHNCDAMRYVVVDRDPIARAGLRVVG